MGKKAKNKQSELSDKMFAASEKQLKRYNDEQIVQRKLLQEQKSRYRQFEFKNPYADMENVMEDITVDTRAAEFQAQQGAQQRANIMQRMQGAAGGSGIAALAQAMANQGQLATQRASASIGMQEGRINQLRAGEASRLQLQERRGEQYAESLRLQGAETARGLEWSKTGTLLGMSQERLGAANKARADAKAQQMQAVGDIGDTGMQLASVAGGGMGGGPSGGGGAPQSGGYLDSQGNEVSVMPGYEDQFQKKAPDTEWKSYY